MPFDVAEAADLVTQIARDEQVRVTVGGAARGGLAVGLAATAGALLFGPVGLAIGGAIGGAGAAVAMQDRFLSLPDAVSCMSTEQKQVLAAKVERIAAGLNVTDVAQFGLLLAGNEALRARVVQEVITLISGEMQLAINR